MILVSIVIPVYNKEKYIEDCLQSILNQSYESIEVIIVNDGSTDESFKIIKSYSDVDHRIRIIDQENQGVAVARNKGIDIAKGHYVYFLDADDLVPKDSIRTLVKKAKRSSSEIIVGNYYRKTNDEFEKNNYYNEQIVTKHDLTSIQFQAEMFLFRQRALASSCNKLYKKDFLTEHRIRFSSGVFAEDRLFNLMCYIHDPEIHLVDDYTYVYRIIEGTRSRKFVETHTDEIINIYNLLAERIYKKGSLNKYTTLLFLNMLFDMDNILRYQFRYNPDRALKKYRNALSKFRSNNYIEKVLQTVNLGNVFKNMEFGTLYKTRMKLFVSFDASIVSWTHLS